MALSEEVETGFWQEFQQYQQERQMPYITSLEQMLINRAIKQEKLSAIELGLELKFGNEGLQLLPEICEIKDIEVLETIKVGLRTANNLNELRSIYQPNDTEN